MYNKRRSSSALEPCSLLKRIAGQLIQAAVEEYHQIRKKAKIKAHFMSGIEFFFASRSEAVCSLQDSFGSDVIMFIIKYLTR
jgi:hypothetical protein